MMKRTALPVLLLAACSTNGDAPTEPGEPLRELPRSLTTDERAVVGSVNDFGFGLLNRVAATESQPNIVLSPLSASLALGMLLNGASGETLAGMRDALSIEEIDEPQVGPSYAGLLELLAGLDPAVRFDIANSVWTREGFPIEQPFLEAAQRYFDATVRTVRFDDPATVDVINGWVSENTSGRIDEIIDRISPDDVLYLINAIYFKGEWRTQFDPERTASGRFTTRGGSTVDVQMMSMSDQSHLFARFEDGTRVLEMPYGRGAYSMVVVQPPMETDAFEVAASLDAAQWNEWIAGLDSAVVAVRMPKFQLEYERLLNDDLIALGMEQAFQPRAADFARLTPEQVYVSFVKQKTFLEVDEVGTEAAAVTAVGVRAVSLGPHIHLDRPFIFAIRERLSGTIVFLGVIGDPSR